MGTGLNEKRVHLITTRLFAVSHPVSPRCRECGRDPREAGDSARVHGSLHLRRDQEAVVGHRLLCRAAAARCRSG